MHSGAKALLWMQACQGIIFNKEKLTFIQVYKEHMSKFIWSINEGSIRTVKLVQELEMLKYVSVARDKY